MYPLTEDSKLGPWDSFGNYGTNKAAAESIFEKFARKHKSRLTIFRPVYLLGSDNYFDREHYYFSRLEKGLPILVSGNGAALIQFAFLDETADAFVNIPSVQKEHIEIINVAGNEYCSVVGFVELCAAVSGKRPDIRHVDPEEHGLEEDAFYDDVYPFPNLNFVVSNNRLTQKYKIKLTPLDQGLEVLYHEWKKKWDGKVRLYDQEKAILRRMMKV